MVDGIQRLKIYQVISSSLSNIHEHPIDLEVILTKSLWGCNVENREQVQQGGPKKNCKEEQNLKQNGKKNEVLKRRQPLILTVFISSLAKLWGSFLELLHIALKA